MSLYFKERIEEDQSEDPEKEMIMFCRSWILSIPPVPDTPETFQKLFIGSFLTTSDINSAKWNIELTNNYVKIEPDNLFPLTGWSGSCYFTYNLYSDFEMRSEFYSSKRISLTEEENSFVTSDGAIKKLSDAIQGKKIAKMVFFIQLELPKIFFTFLVDFSSLKFCEGYPEDMDSDFRFEFLKDGDFTFKCPDGTVPAMKMVMNVTVLKKYLKETKNDEFVVDHAVDVVKPLITYYHSGCFQMPTAYNLDFADRLIESVKFFEHDSEKKLEVLQAICMSLCQKFIKQPHDFELILQWASFVSRYSIPLLYIMVSTTIAHKYYHQFLERFPENTGIAKNQLFREIFRDVTNIYGESLSIKAILAVEDVEDIKCNCGFCDN